MTALAFKAAYSDWKLIKTRGVVQVVMEVPLAEADAAYGVLGGMPNAANEVWFGIAAINPQAEKEKPKAPPIVSPAKLQPETDKPSAGAKRDWRDLQPAQQAGIRCDEPVFEAFLKETRPDDWHESRDAAACVRLICGVESRAELGTKHAARVIWHQLDEQFQAWKALEHA